MFEQTVDGIYEPNPNEPVLPVEPDADAKAYALARSSGWTSAYACLRAVRRA